MKYPSIPKNESERLAALHRYLILDTHEEEAFDQIVWLVSHICKTPVAYISIIDKDRQWFKSKIGIEAAQTPRDISFCAHAILEKHVLLVPDAMTDDRFEDNPLVLSDPRIRFYAGVPLLSKEGLALGTLCAVDHLPRTLSEDQLQALNALSRQVEALLELRRSNIELKEAIAEVKILSGLLPVCAWCKRVRDEEGNWRTIEVYLNSHSEASLTHGICPDCTEKFHKNNAGSGASSKV